MIVSGYLLRKIHIIRDMDQIIKTCSIRKLSMEKHRSMILGCLGLMLSVCSVNSNADEVTYFDRLPSPEEIRKILWPKTEESNVPTLYSGTRGGGRGTELVITETKPSNISVSSTSERIGVGLPIAFDYNSSEIKPEGKIFLDEFGKSMIMSNSKNNFLIIEGHTDAFGSDKYNLLLSERRARAVKNYLVNNYKILPSRLRIAGLGEKKPREGKDPYDEINRRVEFFSLHGN